MDCWPVHPKPFDDELFSSWMLRVARANGQKIFSLIYLLSPKAANICSNLDNAITADLLSKLANVLHIPFHQAYQTTLQSYEGYLYERSTKKANRKTCILYSGVKQKAFKRYPLQFCPMCLANGEPYYRKRWRVSFITTCTEHHCKLLDRCPNCSSPINPTKLDVGYQAMLINDELARCHSCDFDLRKSSVAPADRGLLETTKWYEDILNKGYASLVPNTWVYSFSFFAVLRHLMRVYVSKNESFSSQADYYDADVLSHNIRYQVLCSLKGIFKSWPYGFVQYCKANNIQYSNLSSISRVQIPFWLDSVSREKIYEPNINPSEESVINAIDYMISRNVPINITTLNKLLGYEDSGVVKKILKRLQHGKQIHLAYSRS